MLKAGAAKYLGVVQPCISEIACQIVDKPSLDDQAGLCVKAGVSVAVKVVATPFLQGPDVYGRTVADIFVNGRNVAEVLRQVGH